MKQLCLVSIVFLVFSLSVTARAGEWCLWQYEISPHESKKLFLLEEFETLEKCQDGAKKTADLTFSWARHDETIKYDTVGRTVNPDGVIFIYKTGVFYRTEYWCYSSSMMPSEPCPTP
jgi:hypothetical protein